MKYPDFCILRTLDSRQRSIDPGNSPAYNSGCSLATFPQGCPSSVSVFTDKERKRRKVSAEPRLRLWQKVFRP